MILNWRGLGYIKRLPHDDKLQTN